MTGSRSAGWTTGDPDGPVVVVGAGIIGLSAAWHLVAAGATAVTVVDAGEPGQATTAAGAGFVALWSAGAVDFVPAALPLQRYGLDFYRALASAPGGIGYRANGNLVLATDEATWQANVAPIARHRLASPGTTELSPAEVGDLTRVVDPLQVVGGVLMPSGIQLETNLAAAALARDLVRRGGRLRVGTAVARLRSNGDGVDAVITADGERLPAAHVVVAAGAWTNEVLASLDVRLPLIRRVATRVVTNPFGVPESLPTIQCHGFPLWVRQKDGGLTWGTAKGYSSAEESEARNGTVWSGRPDDPALLASALSDGAQLEALFPNVVQAGVRTWLQGMPVHTPDGQLIAGMAPGAANVVVLAGDNEAGITHGPAMGRIAGELIRCGRSAWDISPFRPDRFASEASQPDLR